jgi:hypothetical protein
LRFFDVRQAPASDDGVAVMVQHEGGESRRVVLRRDAINRGVFRGTLIGLARGGHKAWVVSPTSEDGAPRCEFSVKAPDNEMSRMEADFVGLKRAAEWSGGRFYTFASSDRLLADLPEGGPVRVEPLAARPVWNSTFAAVLFVTLLAAEWLLRKRAGLL